MVSIGRRQFVASALAAGASLAAPDTTAGAEPPRKTKYRYIDIHTHLGTFYWGKELSVDGLIQLMDKNSVERAVVLPLVTPEATN